MSLVISPVIVFNKTMHELPITENIRDIVVRHAQEAGGGRITDVYIVIGKLSSMVDDSIQFYWDMICEDTPAQGAHLHFKRIAPRLVCQDCSLEYEPAGEDLVCPSCDGINVRILQGKEFYVEAIEIEPLVQETGTEVKSIATR